MVLKGTNKSKSSSRGGGGRRLARTISLRPKTCTSHLKHRIGTPKRLPEIDKLYSKYCLRILSVWSGGRYRTLTTAEDVVLGLYGPCH
jgi:hypothetical protein